MSVAKLKFNKTLSFEKQITIVILISLCIHTLFFFGYAFSSRNLRNVFDFLNGWEKPAEVPNEIEKRIEFELVETPEDAESEPPDETNFLSDKNAKARDEYIEPDKPTDDAYSDGDYETKEIERSQRLEAQQLFQDMFVSKKPDRDAEQNKESKTDKTVESNILLSKNILKNFSKPRFSNEEFTRAALVGQSKAHLKQKSSRQRLLHKQEKFSADNLGGFSLNTYAWSWAPYLLYMKEKINNNLFPPPAFYRMGLISGTTLVSFRVMRDGKITNVNVLKYNGHRSLMETSVNSLKGSNPFKPLPGDFPKSYEYLEVTARFEFIIGN